MTEDEYEKAMQECIKTPLDSKKLEDLYNKIPDKYLPVEPVYDL
jgi:hypothetical protein